MPTGQGRWHWRRTVASSRDKTCRPSCALALCFLHSDAPIDTTYAGTCRSAAREGDFELAYEYAQRQRDRAENREFDFRAAL
jgi:hypothetical protein